MDLHIDSRHKMYILWGVIGVLILSWIVSCHNKNVRIEEENEAQVQFEKKKVRPLLKEVNEAGLKKEEGGCGYSTQAIKERLENEVKRKEQEEEESRELYAYLKERSGSEQPEAVCREWCARAKRLKELQENWARAGEEAKEAYARQVEEWESNAQRDAAAKAGGAQGTAEELIKRIEGLRKEARKRMEEVEPEEAAYNGYAMDMRKLNRHRKSLEEMNSRQRAERESIEKERSAIMGEDAKVNHEAKPIQELEAMLECICRAMSHDTEGLAEPTVLPAPPPPPFEPDVRIVTTGDLAEELLVPLVEEWLTERGASSLKGDSFVWNTPDEVTKEIEVKVPQDLQGKDQGRLRIRIVTELNSDRIFDSIKSGKEKAELVFTGRKMNGLQEKEWLPVGQTPASLDPAGHGRAYRTRVCSDALLFFRGEGIGEACLNAELLRETPKQFSKDDAGRMEAAAIFGLMPTGADAQDGDTRGKSIRSLCTRNRGRLVLGCWHKDSQSRNSAMTTTGGPTLSYAAGLSTGGKKVSTSYKQYVANAMNRGCAPAEGSINSGQYAFAYNITFYRATTPKPEAVAAADLLAWAGDMTNAKVESVVKSRGFVPVSIEKPRANGQLTEADLPLNALINALEPYHFGYTKGVSTWVNGVRISVPLYYAVGSAVADEKSVAIDPDSAYYTEKQAVELIRTITKGRQACLVIVGHADPQYGGKLDAGESSWKFNDKLSRQRAESIYGALFAKAFPDNFALKHVTLGCSWSRPACDINMERGIELQEGALSRCRRVEVFVVFPLTEETED